MSIKDWVAGNPQQQDFTYDDLDRLSTAEVTDGTGGTYSEKSYSYNSSTGNLISKEGVSYTYGDSNHPHAVTSLSNDWEYSYDALGNLVRQTDARGKRICLYYDNINRIGGKHYRTDDNCPSQPTLDVTYTFDDTTAGNEGIGRRTGMSDDSGTTAWVYDDRGRVIEEEKIITGGGTFVTQWGYNSGDQVVFMKYPGGDSGQIGEEVTLTYLDQGALDSIVGTEDDSPYTYVQGITYDAPGRIISRKLGSDFIETIFDYYAWTYMSGRLKSITTDLLEDPYTAFQDLEYSYDDVGNIMSIKDWVAGISPAPQQQDFIYDAMDRLETANITGGVGGMYDKQWYGYDSSTGNLSSIGEGEDEETAVYIYYTYGDSNHPHAVTSLSNDWEYSYDANGNQTERGDGSTDYTLTYDVENRLQEVDGDAAATFVYDGDGNRVKGTVGSVTTIYVGEYYEVEMGTTDIIRKYYYAGGARVAMREGSTLYWLLTDHLGSTTLTINTYGGLESEKRYMPWGETRYEWEATNPPFTSFQYTGQRVEEGLGIYYYGARWYDPALGRFIQADNIVPDLRNPQSLNRYAYVLNNPIKFVDPTGHYNCEDAVVCKPPIGYRTINLNIYLTIDGRKTLRLFRFFSRMKLDHPEYFSEDYDLLSEFTAFILGKESYPTHERDAWFEGGMEGFPEFFEEGARGWFWGYVETNYGVQTIQSQLDLRNAILNWLGAAMQSSKGMFPFSEDRLSQEMETTGSRDPGFLEIADAIIFDSSRPWNVLFWANPDLMPNQFSDRAVTELKVAKVGTGEKDVAYRFDDKYYPWYLFTPEQDEHWKAR